MARFLVHGLVVETASSLGWDPGAELLAGFPEAAPGPAASLHIAIAERSATPAAATEADETILIQPSARVAVRGGAIVVEAPGFSATVPLTGDRIEALIHSAGIDRRTLADVDLFLAFAAAMRLRGWYHLHAACTVGPADQPLLIAGQAGSGKSTLCAALVSAGHRYLGDDVVFLEGGTGRLLGFPRHFHLGPAAVAAIPAAASHLSGRYGAGEKVALDARAAFPGLLVERIGHPSAVLLPVIQAGRVATTVTSLSSLEAAGALLESSMFLASRLPGLDAHVLALTRLAEAAPAFRVELGQDLLRQAATTAHLIAMSVGAR